jgi:hypothetical protein
VISSVIVTGVLLGGVLAAIQAEGTRIEAVSALTAVAAPPSDFAREAERSLTDLGAGLDTITGTLDRGGYWGVLTGSVDMSYAAAHLRTLEAPATISVQWRSALDHLDAGIAAIDDGIASAEDGAIRVAVNDARVRFESLTALVASVP